MHTYSAARTYFSLLEFLAWVAIVIGGIVILVALGAGGASGRGVGFLVGLTAALPGFSLIFLGFFGLVFAQVGRAGVDSAKNSYESLEIAKKQLRMAEERERREERSAKLVAAGAAVPAPQQSTTTNADGKTDVWKEEAAAMAPAGYAPPPTGSEPPAVEKVSYQGITIEVKPDGAFIYGQRFRDLEAAKLHIEREGIFGATDAGTARLVNRVVPRDIS